MAQTIWGDRFLTSEASTITADKSQKVTFTKNRLLVAIRSKWVFFNNPSLTDITFRIYGERDSAPGLLLFTSTTRTKAELITADNGIIESYWEFNSPDGVPLRKDTPYWFVPILTGYTGTVSSHVAWAKDWPDVVYKNSGTAYEDLHRAKRFLTFISAEFE